MPLAASRAASARPFQCRAPLAARDLQRPGPVDGLERGEHRAAVRERDDVERGPACPGRSARGGVHVRPLAEKIQGAARQQAWCAGDALRERLEASRVVTGCERRQRRVPDRRHAGLCADERSGRVGDVGTAGERLAQDLYGSGRESSDAPETRSAARAAIRSETI